MCVVVVIVAVVIAVAVAVVVVVVVVVLFLLGSMTVIIRRHPPALFARPYKRRTYNRHQVHPPIRQIPTI